LRWRRGSTVPETKGGGAVRNARTSSKIKTRLAVSRGCYVTDAKWLLNQGMLTEFGELVAADPSEEQVHQFLDAHRPLLACLYSPFTIRYEDYAFAGALSKFPVAPDRVPDFTLFCIQDEVSNMADEIIFLELKKPSARLYTGRGRMSRDLNDAWAECIGTIRVIGTAYEDFLRRLQKSVAKTIRGSTFRHLPFIKSIILIGRRSSLSPEEFNRIHEVSACTSQTIRIMTYDSLLQINQDRLRDIEEIQAQNADWKLQKRG
jgi:hypothetical protein